MHRVEETSHLLFLQQIITFEQETTNNVSISLRSSISSGIRGRWVDLILVGISLTDNEKVVDLSDKVSRGAIDGLPGGKAQYHSHPGERISRT